MRQLTEKMIEKGKKMYVVFVDLEKAYDKLCREELWEVLRRYVWCVRWSVERD